MFSNLPGSVVAICTKYGSGEVGSGNADRSCELMVGGKTTSWVRSWDAPNRPKDGGSLAGASSGRLEVWGRPPDQVTPGSSCDSCVLWVGSIAAPGSWVSKTTWMEPSRSG